MKPENISTQDLKRYLNGECSSDEMFRIEKAMQADPFLLESVEGLEEEGAMEGFEELQNRFRSKHGTSSSPSIWKKSSTWVIALLGAAVVILLVMQISDTDELAGQRAKSEVAENKAVESGERSDEKSFAQDSVAMEESFNEIDQAVVIPEEEQITYEKAIANQPITVEERETAQEMTAIDSAMMQDMENMSPVETPEAELELDPMVEKSNVKILYFHDLKVVDYSSFYAKEIKIRNYHIPGNTKAYYQNIKTSPSEIVGPYTIIPYREYIDSTMSYFNRNDFKSTLKNLHIVIDHFPDDINAHFYGALCHYNLGQWEKAKDFFQKVLENPIYTFDQEAEFYLAKTLAQNGETFEAKELFRKIAEEGKFYAGRATKELKRLH